jgi:putative redox protein
MSATIKTKYLDNLRTESIHIKSGKNLFTDAPVDNQGKGETFSPTDLLATSLASCMLTIMGIAANKFGLNIDGVDCGVSKIMSSNLRKISEIIINFDFPKNSFNEEQKQILRDAAYSCPVALSLHPDLRKNITFNFND